MIRRTFDPAFLNQVCNHKDIRPWLGGEGAIDLTDLITNTDNFALVCDYGGFLLHRHDHGVYEVHSQFLPEGRAHTATAMRAGFDYMFTRTDCHTVLTQVADNNIAALALAKRARFRPLFRREDTPRGPSQFFALTLDEWVQGNRSLEEDGEWFHARLEQAKAEQGSSLPVHPHDAAHERAVGATVRMLKAGNAIKAVAFYNRWAAFAGYAQITLISQQPPTIDVVDAVVEVRGQDMEICLCR